MPPTDRISAELAERILIVLDNAHYIIDHCSQSETPAARAWFDRYKELRAPLAPAAELAAMREVVDAMRVVTTATDSSTVKLALKLGASALAKLDAARNQNNPTHFAAGNNNEGASK